MHAVVVVDPRVSDVHAALPGLPPGTDPVTLDPAMDSLALVASGATSWASAADARLPLKVVTGTSGADVLLGTASADILKGLAGNDILRGRAGDDTLDGGIGSDTMYGGIGDDVYIVNSATDVVSESSTIADEIDTVRSGVIHTLGANVENLTLSGLAIGGAGNALDNLIYGNRAANNLYGNTGDDTLLGGVGSDTLRGGAGRDSLNGGSGADRMTGGSGNDIYVVDAVGDVTTETSTVATEIDKVISSVTRTLGANIERLALSGGAEIDGTGNGLANRMAGNGAANTLSGLSGNDTLLGLGGHDELLGGNGNDSLDGGLGNDTLDGGTGTDRLVGGEGSDRLVGGDGTDSLRGDAGNDTLDGGLGNDNMQGGAGDDTYAVDSLSDTVIESADAGTDTVNATVDWTLGDNVDNLVLGGLAGARVGTGNDDANTITGNKLANTLAGLGGADTLGAGDGADTLLGGAGNDSLTGGAGADDFVFDSTTGSDTVTDFVSGTDGLVFDISALAIGNLDAVVDAALTRTAPGGWGAGNELVVFTTDVASLTAANAAAAIGSADAAVTLGHQQLFVVDTGSSSGVYLFTSNGDSQVTADELSLLATLDGTGSTATGDYAFTP